MSVINNECKGCLVFLNDGRCSTGIKPHMLDIEDCPCLTCLIKGICRHACTALINYRKAYILSRRKLKRENNEQ